MLSTIGFGKCTFPTTTLRLSAFAVSDNTVFVDKAFPVLQKIWIPTSLHDKYDGGFFNQVFDIPDGTILRLQASKTYRGLVSSEAAIHIRVRSDAATLSVALITPVDRRNDLDQVSAFMGRGDILSSDELLEMGVELSKSFVNRFLCIDEINECFIVTEIEPELNRPPAIVGVIVPENGANPIHITRKRRNIRVG